MIKKLFIALFVTVLLGNISAATFSTIDNAGLSFANPSTTAQVKTILCTFQAPLLEPTCIEQFVSNKIIGKIPDTMVQQIAAISPNAANSIRMFNSVKDMLNDGAKIQSPLVLDENANIIQGSLSFGYTGSYVGNMLGMENNQEAFAKNIKIDFSRLKKYTNITFLLDNRFELLQGEEKTIFENLQAHYQKTNSFLKLDFNATIIEADFTTIHSRGSTYILGNDKIYLPGNSRLLFRNGTAEIFISDNANLRELPNLIDSDLFGNEIEIKGKNIQLPGGESVLDKGVITYKNGVPYVKAGDEAVINHFKITPGKEDIKVDFEDSFSWDSEDNFVDLSEDEILLNGNGAVEFNPVSFVNKEESEALNPFMKSLSLSDSKNGKYFTLGDRGGDVVLIQKLVGVEEDGVYGKITQDAVKTWQKENGIKVDGLFGQGSLETSLGADSTKNIKIISDSGRVLVSRDDGRLGLDITGESIVKVGTKIFDIENIQKNDFLSGFSFDSAKNNKYFKRGDEGKEVKLIQRLVGVTQGGVFEERTEEALKRWQQINGLKVTGTFDGSSLSSAMRSEPTLYKEIKGGLTTNLGVPLDLTLRDSNGEEISKLYNAEGPGFIETIQNFVGDGVKNKGYFTSMYKTSGHLNNVVFDNVPEPGSLTNDKGIVSNTVVPATYLSKMEAYVETLPKDMDPDERFNLVVRKSGEVANYEPETSLKLISVFGSRYKDLSPNFAEGYGNRQIVNNKDTSKYKDKVPPMSSKVASQLGLPQDTGADKKYRLIWVAGQYLYTPDSFLKGTKIGLEHTMYEALAFFGKKARQSASPGSNPKYGSGDFGDISADFGGVSFGEDLQDNPEETLKNFDIGDYL